MAQGSPTPPEYKKAIVSVKKYFDRTRDDLREQDCNSIERTANALNVGTATVRRVMADYNKDPELLEKFSFHRKSSRRILADSLQTVTREYVRQANHEGTYLSLARP